MVKKYPYGFKALFESMYNAEQAEKSADELTDTGLGIGESVSFLDAIDAGLLSEDEVENDMDAEYDDGVSDELFNKIDALLPDDDDEDIDDIVEEGINVALENYLDYHDSTEDLYALE